MKATFIGKWICTPEFSKYIPRNVYHKEHSPALYKESPDDPKNLHVLFNRKFTVKKVEGRYVLRISADDYGKYYLNGAFIGQGPTPGYIESYHYNEFDVTDYLRDGENEFTAHVYYQGLNNRVWISGDLRMGLIADLYDPTGEAILSTDESWEYVKIENYLPASFYGERVQYTEHYDSRIPLGEFKKAALKAHDDIEFADAPTRPLQVYVKKPVKTEKLPSGAIFYDFGTEITATLRIKAKGHSGDRIRILCGEEIDDNEYKVRYMMRANCHYDEKWILDDGESTLEQYDYKAFRYVTLVSESESAEIEDLVAVVRHMTFDDNACTIEADSKVLEQVFNLCKTGVKYGSQEVFVDCPSREKGQYAGDMTVTSGAHLWLTGDVYMLEKGILDHARSTKICKGLMAVLSGALMQEIADYSLQFPLLLLRHYQFTGNKEFLASMLPVAEGMLEHFGEYAREDGLLDGVKDKWNLVDWPRNLRDNYDFPLTKPIGDGAHNVLNAFYVGSVLNVEEIKDILGIPHANKGAKLADAFNKAFFRKDLGVYVDCEGSDHASLHSNMLAPFYGFVPAGYEESVAEHLMNKGMVCGVYMSYFLMRGLCRLGKHEYVYDLITSEDENSWYNMIRDGATACIEAWGKDKKDNTSFCHPWACAPITVLIEDLLGVSYDGTVGEHHIPKKAGRIKMKIPTRIGTININV
ncbi:MAG: family 78 glycoside hydrolase catalytic domain [Clostridia bacterium]|nr:family 78 glycoside hydrolase catalytic domain [Clostridia bacterium]